jgi:hypothetical protein
MTLRHWDNLLSGEVAGPPGPSGTSEEAAGDVEDLAGMASKLAVRDSSGDAAFRQIAVAIQLEVGTASSGKASLEPTHVEVGASGKARLQATTPTATGHIQVDPTTGRAFVYIEGEARELVTFDYVAPAIARKAADSSAMTTLAEHTVFEAPAVDGEIYAIRWRPDADMFVNTSPDVAIVEFLTRDADGDAVGGVTATVAIGGTGDVDAFDVYSFSVGSPISLPADGAVTLSIEKEGAGVQIPSGSFAIYWRYT